MALGMSFMRLLPFLNTIIQKTDPEYNLHNTLVQCCTKSPAFSTASSCERVRHCWHPLALSFLVLQLSKSRGICKIKGRSSFSKARLDTSHPTADNLANLVVIVAARFLDEMELDLT
ncbi:uncharacterized protein LOC131327066 [Rhododendron vialii]|uniref:uncharacterized protein LOC131327066 n=1 Tax=Rhododendron vialii TaxID=182163 RepID=UPI0026604C09|nr:uncharacterized protein LOC131327066 [Rhododendron vialii]